MFMPLSYWFHVIICTRLAGVSHFTFYMTLPPSSSVCKTLMEPKRLKKNGTFLALTRSAIVKLSVLSLQTFFSLASRCLLQTDSWLLHLKLQKLLCGLFSFFPRLLFLSYVRLAGAAQHWTSALSLPIPKV